MTPVDFPLKSIPRRHVFVDFENVHLVDLTIFDSPAASFTLLIGPRQAKLDVALVVKLFEHAPTVNLVRLAAGGRNALDFILTYHLGRAVAADPTGCFHIVSKDKDFDSLIEHLRGKNIQVSRHDDFAALTNRTPATPPAPVVSVPQRELKSEVAIALLDDRAMKVMKHLEKPSATHPRTKAKLLNFLNGYFGKKITETEAAHIVDRLIASGRIVVTPKGAVSYPKDLPGGVR
jgi:hypothetical protein